MKFGEAFSDYLRKDRERFLDKCSHVEYKRLKKVLKKCRVCRAAQQHHDEEEEEEEEEEIGRNGALDLCSFESESCSLCDQMFFTELTKEASEIAGCFISRVRRLLHPSDSFGLQRYLWRLRHCFMDDQQIMIQEGRLLLDYITMNSIAIRKILKKYDKIHRSVNGRNFKTKMRAEHLELLQSPWLIELAAFYINLSGSSIGEPGEFFRMFSCDLCDTQPRMIIMLSDCVMYEYSLTCSICLEIVFNPYALGCGHLFCKECACSAASVLLFQGLKAASHEAKCPVCREVGVYSNAVHMTGLDLLVKNRF
ncbi:Zinc finger RING/FYVE/PHD-type protein [Dioscorea alata]|uniref:Zinc finger RING/FYVE/PHD-type protein n=1 Tax=Dioscorea alata TaxID=55571 RepID=A0ACB7UMJ8_DIOAL|nr:Zinc finger RING/FYVE/PHD-type protein [Dioscorea alata]